MRMKYLSTFEAAEKWGISHRRVNVLCNEGRYSDRPIPRSYEFAVSEVDLTRNFG